eukprot:scaffold141271_cov139-Phaeocystis_antarctica.AAC.1
MVRVRVGARIRVRFGVRRASALVLGRGTGGCVALPALTRSGRPRRAAEGCHGRARSGAGLLASRQRAGVDSGLPDLQGAPRAYTTTPRAYYNYSTRHGCVLQVMESAGHECVAREGPSGAPAAQTPSALGRPARSAACRSSARGGEDGRGGC